MPTSPEDEDDVEISALLNQAEPPKSPQHLDAEIMRYARQKAAERKDNDARGTLFGGASWIRKNWIPAAASFSVAAIAVSVSLQLFTEPELAGLPASVRSDSFTLSESLAVAETDSSNLEQERQEVFVTPDRPAANAPAIAPQSLADTDRAATTVRTRPAPATANSGVIAEESVAAVNADASASKTVELADTAAAEPAQPQSRQNRADDAAPEIAAAGVNTVVTASPIERRSAAPSTIATTEIAAEFISSLRSDTSLQDTVIIALRRALGVREQTSVVRRGEFTDEIRIYLETYRGIRDATILANIQNRYGVARSELIEARLPETIVGLVSMLDQLIQ